jgi:4-amino-4-deoxy-L-arabinose transferase-like glycosyltransferase
MHSMISGKHLRGGLVVVVGVALLLFLALYHQPFYPATWLDEGFVLQGAINLVHSGHYAMRSSEGLRILDQPLIANGPGVVLPVAAAFALFGTGLMQARGVMVVFLLVSVILSFILGKRLYGIRQAIAATFLLLALPQEGLVFFGRQVLGNVPAFAYFLAGYLLWLVTVDRDQARYAGWAGLLFGLALVTKGQYYLLLGAIVLTGLIEWFYYRRPDVARSAGLALITTLGCLAIWYVAQWALVGPANFRAHLEAVRASSAVTVAGLRGTRILGNAWYLVRSGDIMVLGPGVIYALWQCIQRRPGSSRQLLLLVFVTLWSSWFVLISVGWHRYALDAYAAGVLLAGNCLVDMVGYVRRQMPLGGRRRTIQLLPAGAALLVGTTLLIALAGFTGMVKDIIRQPDRSAVQFAAYLQQNTDPETVIESWEWEIDALTNLRYHHPTNEWVDKMTAILQFHENIDITYDPFQYRPEYLIDGPFSKWTGIYASSIAKDCCTLTYHAGPYDFYKVKAQLGR